MRRFVMDDISGRIAQLPISDFLHMHAGYIAKYLVSELVDDDARKGDDRYEPSAFLGVHADRIEFCPQARPH